MSIVRAITIATLLLGVAMPRGASAQTDVDQLGFLTGCWEMQRGDRVTHEQWMAPLGGLMLGISRTVAGDVAREWEAMQIGVREGRVVFAAQPGGRTPTFFAATEISDSAVHFANPDNDFPERISYRRHGADSLLARIESGQGDSVRGIDFRMRRVSCGVHR